MRLEAVGIALFCIVIGTGSRAAAAEPSSPTPVAIALPDGEGGIGLDDIAYSNSLGRLLVPGGRTGKLDLVDPASLEIVSIPGFSVGSLAGGHDDGITSVAQGAGLLFVIDRTALQLSLVDPTTKTIVAHNPLGASPDFVRWLEPAHELWVTEPDSERIEVFRFVDGTPPTATAVTTIEVPGGPESLEFDIGRGRAYTNIEEAGETVAIDLKSRAIVATWKNGCTTAKGIALDPERGFLFVGCEEGGAAAIDLTTGEKVGGAALGGGIDLIAYDRQRGHLYVPCGETATLAILGVSPHGKLKLLGTFATAADSHCIAIDGSGKVYVSDPNRGGLLVVTDPYPSSPH